MEDRKEKADNKEQSSERQERQMLYAETIPFLLQWYEYNKRILPWREQPTPYHVWVSEIMLQQTRVEAVRGYYDRFLSRLPEIKALAAAEEEVLLKLWEGLGYYNRVRNMQKAARLVCEQYGGELPADYEKIRALPGIGEYTAGAISSIAFGLPYPAVDGNVLRVMSRIACSEEDIAKEQTKRKLNEDLIKIIPPRSGDFNQSLMELGATVCLPNGKPLCEQCPVMHLCKAFHAGRETELPVKTGKKERRIEKRTVYLVFCGDKVLLHRRPERGLLAGLWEFPNVLTDGKTAKADGQIVKKGKKAKHIFSHVEWHMEGIVIEADKEADNTPERLTTMIRRLTELCGDKPGKGKTSAGSDMDKDSWVFVTRQELRETYPVPSAFEVYVKEALRKH